MAKQRHTAGGRAVTELILEIFRLNGRLLVAGDRLVAGLGLTSARWQVLGAIAYAERPEPVAWLARSMGLNRQGVQRIVNELVDEGLVELRPNPHHRRAHHVVLKDAGRKLFDSADRLQIPWANALAKGMENGEIATARRIISSLHGKLDAG